MLDEVGRVRPVEMLLAEGELAALSSGRQPTLSDEAGKDGPPGSAADGAFEGVRTTTGMEDWVFTAEYAVPLLRRHFGVHSLDGMGLAGHEAAATAAGALVHYLQKTKQGGLEHIDTIRFYERAGCLVLDAVSVRNLELVEPLFAGESAQTTLFHTLDACSTPMGKRLLRATLLRPANDLGEIEARLDAVAEAVAGAQARRVAAGNGRRAGYGTTARACRSGFSRAAGGDGSGGDAGVFAGAEGGSRNFQSQPMAGTRWGRGFFHSDFHRFCRWANAGFYNVYRGQWGDFHRRI